MKLRLFLQCEEVAKKAFDELKVQNSQWFQILTNEFLLTPSLLAKIAYYHSQRFIYLDPSATSFSQLLKDHFSQPEDSSRLRNFIDYLMSERTYAISTIEAGGNVPIVGKKTAIFLGFRHGYISVLDSPFSNDESKKQIIEFSPGVATDESKRLKVSGSYLFVPGAVILSLISASHMINASNAFNLRRYRPWKHDCITYITRVQHIMNKQLEELHPPLVQKVIRPLSWTPEKYPSQEDLLKMVNFEALIDKRNSRRKALKGSI